MVQFTPKKILQLLLVFLIAAFLICCLHSCVNDGTPKNANIQSVPELKLVATGPHGVFSLYQYTDADGHTALIVYTQTGAISITKLR